MPATTPISTHDINRIAAIEDPVLRNLQITQCYSDISTLFATYTGERANWCTFATWASRQAGQTIRHEDVKRTLSALLLQDPYIKAEVALIANLARKGGARQTIEQLRNTTIAAYIDQTATEASHRISYGNKKVFEEIGFEFARFINSCLDNPGYNEIALQNYLAALRPGFPPDGQDYLRNAFINYYQAIFEENEKAKDELIFLANLLIGFHEQNRLQMEIEYAMNASEFDAEKIKLRLLSLLSTTNKRNWLNSIIDRWLGDTRLLHKAIKSLNFQVHLRLRNVLSQHFMTITLPPNNRIYLGRDLTSKYPECLQVVSKPALKELLRRIDPTPDSLLESGATDWANLEERMHFIAELFRCYHLEKNLFSPPFTKLQSEAILLGRVPAGEL